MKMFIRQLFGGTALIAVSLLVGVIYNSFSSNKIQLFPQIQNAGAMNAGLQGTTSSPMPGDSALSSPEPDSFAVRPADRAGLQGIIPLDKARALFDAKKAVFMDARDAKAFAEGRIPGAMNVPYDKLPDYYETVTATVPQDTLIVCYCWGPTCDFSDNLASELVIIGYTNVVIFRGGWEEWQKAGYPAEGLPAQQPQQQ
ncbi:MAG: rhodanese-like domain-containing protein [Chitinivibrionia bacterium]|nr:rhodanese-like domain-containing protein [Chitinivibrionia bacterium]